MSFVRSVLIGRSLADYSTRSTEQSGVLGPVGWVRLEPNIAVAYVRGYDTHDSQRLKWDQAIGHCT